MSKVKLHTNYPQLLVTNTTKVDKPSKYQYIVDEMGDKYHIEGNICAYVDNFGDKLLQEHF